MSTKTLFGDEIQRSPKKRPQETPGDHKLGLTADRPDRHRCTGDPAGNPRRPADADLGPILTALYVAEDLRSTTISGHAYELADELPLNLGDYAETAPAICHRITPAIWAKILQHCERRYTQWTRGEYATALMEVLWDRAWPLLCWAAEKGWPVDSCDKPKQKSEGQP